MFYNSHPPQAAFRFFCTDAGETDTMKLALVTADGVRTETNVPITYPQGSGGVFFFGVIDQTKPFVRVELIQLGRSSVADAFAFDDFMAAPATLRLGIRVSEVELSWNSVSNATYRVDYRSSLTTNTWTPLTNCIQAVGPANSVYDKIIAGEPQRFYRVVATNCVP